MNRPRPIAPDERCWRCYHGQADIGPRGACKADASRLGVELQCGCPLFVIGPPDKGVCRSCGAGIVWWLTRAGKPVPCDPDGVNHFATCPNAASHRRRPAASATAPTAPGGSNRGT